MSMTPEQKAQLAAFKEVKVKHARLKEVDQVVTRAINEHASYTQLTVYGPSGAGKTTIAKRIADRCLGQEPDRAVVPIVLVQAHSSDIGAYARWDYYGQVLAQLRNHAAVKDRLMHLALSEQRPGKQMRDAGEWFNMREAVIYALERLRVKAVFIDEAQHLMRVEPPPSLLTNWTGSRALPTGRMFCTCFSGITIYTIFVISVDKQHDGDEICTFLAIVWILRSNVRSFTEHCATCWSVFHSRAISKTCFPTGTGLPNGVSVVWGSYVIGS